jgi:hypothetical protein
MSNGEKSPNKQADYDSFDALVDTGIGEGPLTNEQGLTIELAYQHLLTSGIDKFEAATRLGVLVGGAIRGNDYMRSRRWEQ